MPITNRTLGLQHSDHRKCKSRHKSKAAYTYPLTFSNTKEQLKQYPSSSQNNTITAFQL